MIISRRSSNNTSPAATCGIGGKEGVLSGTKGCIASDGCGWGTLSRQVQRHRAIATGGACTCPFCRIGGGGVGSAMPIVRTASRNGFGCCNRRILTNCNCYCGAVAKSRIINKTRINARS